MKIVIPLQNLRQKLNLKELLIFLMKYIKVVYEEAQNPVPLYLT